MQYFLRLFPYLRRSRRLLVITLVMAALSQAAMLLVPKVVQEIVRQVLGRPVGGIATWALLILLLAIIKGGLSAAETILGTRVGQQVLQDLRQEVYAHICRLKLRFFDITHSGEILSRVTADMDPIDGFFSWGARLIFRSTLLFIGALSFCLNMNWRLTLVSLSFIPLISVTALIIGLRLRPAWQAAREQVGNFTSGLEETLSGIRVVKMNVQEQRENEKLTRASEIIRQKTFLANRIDATYYPLTGLWSGVASLVILAYGGLQVIRGQLTIDQYVSFEMYIIFLMVPMRMLGWMVSGMQRAAVGARRVFELLDEKAEEFSVLSSQFSVARPLNDRHGGPKGLAILSSQLSAGDPKIAENSQLRGRVVFENVSFEYRPGESVLRDINLQVNAGEIVGILGPTGSGKSALVALIPRLYDPVEGRILIDDIDARDYDLQGLRRQVGMVFQEPFLFSGTIRENIVFGRPDAGPAEILEAAKRATIDDFIAGLEKGYETRIGERGLNLSGGQQQRLALARTLLMDPRILILDDSTSSVDADTEFRIQEALAELMVGRTSFIISQRANSVAVANRIIVLEGGEIIEQGTPRELAQIPNGHYRKLLEVQRALSGAEDR